MAGIVGIKFRLMPSSPDINLEEIKTKAKILLEEKNAMKIEITEEPVAFGLKSVNLFFQYDEEKETSEIEEALGNIENVQSCEITDLRKLA
ncbi:MAG: elongation factor 1-beta [Nanoarchaeota archaeon]|nr:elongation factor 1-beta [Nanoarchaeota archaeon]